MGRKGRRGSKLLDDDGNIMLLLNAAEGLARSASDDLLDAPPVAPPGIYLK